MYIYVKPAYLLHIFRKKKRRREEFWDEGENVDRVSHPAISACIQLNNVAAGEKRACRWCLKALMCDCLKCQMSTPDPNIVLNGGIN
jgi:hypothetical protein